jgi:hypothetical protein
VAGLFFFLDDGRCRVTTAESIAQGLQLSLTYAASRAMLRDRVTAPREANVCEAQHCRSVLGTPLIAAVGGSGGRALCREDCSTVRRQLAGDSAVDTRAPRVMPPANVHCV